MSQILNQSKSVSVQSNMPRSSQVSTVSRFQGETGARKRSRQIRLRSIRPRQAAMSKDSAPPGRRKFSWQTTIAVSQLSRSASAVSNLRQDGLCRTRLSARTTGGSQVSARPVASSAAWSAGLTGRSRNMPLVRPITARSVRPASARISAATAVAVPPGKRGSSRMASRCGPGRERAAGCGRVNRGMPAWRCRRRCRHCPMRRRPAWRRRRAGRAGSPGRYSCSRTAS